MPRTESRSVVITGVSTGIGWGTAKLLAQRGFQVFGSVRKPEDGERLRREIGAAFQPLLFDVTDEAAVERAAIQVREHLQGKPLAGLVNNAGMAAGGALLHQPMKEFCRHFEVNLFGMLRVIQKFAPLLKAAPGNGGNPGRIVNIGSLSGKVAAPFLGAYNASKFAVEGFSDSLRRELLLHGIDVIVVRPGPVNTAIWDKAEEARPRELEQYRGTGYEKPLQAYMDVFVKQARKTGFPPEAVGNAVYRALTAKNPRVYYNVIPQYLLNWIMPKLLPARVLDRFFGAQLGLIPKQEPKA